MKEIIFSVFFEIRLLKVINHLEILEFWPSAQPQNGHEKIVKIDFSEKVCMHKVLVPGNFKLLPEMF